MTGTRTSLATASEDTRLLARDLAAVYGALCEIDTTWRRAQAARPDLPPGLPQRLADTARKLAADARLLTGTGQGKAAGLPVPLARQVSALCRDVAAAQAMTHAPGDPGVGDAGLWELLAPAVSS
ncbi:MAG: hypothetical protein ACYCO9_15230 [Streptosporangiaceae bacterium]